MSQIVGPESLGFEFVEKTYKSPLGSFDDGAAVLPDGIFGIVASADRIPLVLVDIVDTEAIGKGFPENVKSSSLADDCFEIRERLDTGATFPGWVQPMPDSCQ